MKKLVYLVLLVSAFGFVNCSSDDSTTTTPQVFDPIIGNWKLIASTSQYENNPPVSDLTNCDLLNTHNFTGVVNSKKGDGISKQFIENTNNLCIQSAILNQEWENIGNNNYTFKQNYQGQILLETIKVTFSNNNMIFTFVDGPYTLISTYTKQ